MVRLTSSTFASSNQTTGTFGDSQHLQAPDRVGSVATPAVRRRENVRERVEAILAAESRCCAFLTMAVAGEPRAGVLDIDARADAAPVLAELVDAFAARARGGPTAAETRL